MSVSGEYDTVRVADVTLYIRYIYSPFLFPKKDICHYEAREQSTDGI